MATSPTPARPTCSARRLVLTTDEAMWKGILAVRPGARLGGVRLAGGVLPHLRPGLLRQGFREHFLDKGAMRAQLERVPVHLVEHGELGVLGAARWHLEQPQTR